MQEQDRPRVTSLFADHAHLLVLADAGSGKSVAARQAVAGRAHGWLELTRHDRPLPVLLRRLVSALRDAGATIPDEVETLADTAVGPDASQDVPAVIARHLADEVAVPQGTTLVLDGLDVLTDVTTGGNSAGLRLVSEMLSASELGVRMILLSRRIRPEGIGRLLASGSLIELTGRALAFTEPETRAVLNQVGLTTGDHSAHAHTGAGKDLSRSVHALTAGWPAAVNLTALALHEVPIASRQTVLDRAGHPDSGLGMLIGEELLTPLPAPARSALDVVATLPWMTPDLWATLDIAPDSRKAIRGLLAVGPDGLYVPELLRRHLLAIPGHEPDCSTLRRAATFYLDAGRPDAAIAALLDHPDSLTELLDDHAALLLARGAVHELAQLDALVPHARRSATSEEAIGNALMVLGDWSGAARAFQRASQGTVMSAGLAWRIGLVHYLRGDVPEALAVYAAAVASPQDDPDEQALLAAMHAAARVAGGDLDGAARILATAPTPPDQHSVAALETSRAMVASGQGNGPAHQRHTDLALAAAGASYSVLQEIRIRSNHASWLIRHGRPDTALEHLAVVLDRAELSGFASLVGLAEQNRGEAHLKLGDLDAAAQAFTASEAVFARTASSMVRYPLIGLAQVSALRGEHASARARVTEALRLSRCRGDITAQVTALSVLARLSAGSKPDDATKAAQEAVSLAGGRLVGVAHLAAGWVAVATGDLDWAATCGAAARDAAQVAGEHLTHAEALALLAAAQPDPQVAAPILRQSLALLHDRTDVLLARDIRSALAVGSGQSAAPNPSALAGPALLLPHLPDIHIRVLGVFTIHRDGVALPDTVWGSRKARDLLRILVARRGRPVPRDRLIELLWPGKPLDAIGNRLSQALSVARSVLDPSRSTGEGPIQASGDSIRLRLDLVEVDSEIFLRTADRALHEPEEDCGVACALALHTGAVFEDDPYPVWTEGLAAEVRAAHVRLLRVQAVAVDIDVATAAALRLLAEDRFDEPSHLALVQRLTDAGRHGEADRAYRSYLSAMAEISVDPARRPLPAPRLVG